jgi:hypothetical protein
MMIGAIMELQLTSRFLTAAALAALIVLTPAAAQTVSEAELRYQEALHKQKVNDLPGAIKLYKQIASTKNGDRAVIANALLGLAGCYEKQGQQSESVYQQIVKDYGDQPAADQARKKLTALRAPATMTQSKIEIAIPGVVKTDGQRPIYQDATTGAIVISDLAGKGKRVIRKGTPDVHTAPYPSRDFSMVLLDSPPSHRFPPIPWR